jgi:hypothetical protein
MYKPSKLTPGGLSKVKILTGFGLLLIGGLLVSTLAKAAEVPFSVYNSSCYNYNSNTNASGCEGATNYFSGNPVLWQPNGASHGNSFSMPEPTKLDYSYAITYQVYRDGVWKPLADLGNRVNYGEQIKAVLTKTAEWRGMSGTFYDTPAAHFKDSFDWSGLQGCYMDDYFGEAEITNNSENARWLRWGLLDSSGHLGYQGARLLAPTIFKNPPVNIVPATSGGFTCSGATCTAPSTGGTYTIKTQVGATEARQQFYILLQSPSGYWYSACNYPGSGFPEAPSGQADYWSCKNQGKLLGCMPATTVRSGSSSKDFGSGPVEASAFIPGWPANGCTDTDVTITVGPGTAPNVTVTPENSTPLENAEVNVTCTAINPTGLTDKIVQIKWSCLNNTSNTSIDCAIFNGTSWITGSDYVIDIPSVSQSTTYTSVVKAKSALKGSYTIKCSATTAASATGTGSAPFDVGACYDDGVCNQSCSYDPDCCKAPYCKDYCASYGINCGGVIAANSCQVIRTTPPMTGNPEKPDTVKPNGDVNYTAKVSGINPTGYVWYCDKNGGITANNNNNASTDSQTCKYANEGTTYEPKTFYKDEKGNTQRCTNASGVGITVGGVKAVTSCNVLVKGPKDSNFTRSTTISQSDSVDIKVDTGTGTRQNPVIWKFNGNESNDGNGSLSQSFNTDTKVEAEVDGKTCAPANVKVTEEVWFR